MTNDINAYYEGARLSEAAYANFSAVATAPDKRLATKAALQGSDCKWSEAMAEDFLNKYELVSQSPSNDPTGFSAI